MTAFLGGVTLPNARSGKHIGSEFLLGIMDAI